jgi:hypothetical protein
MRIATKGLGDKEDGMSANLGLYRCDLTAGYNEAQVGCVAMSRNYEAPNARDGEKSAEGTEPRPGDVLGNLGDM